MHHKAISRSRHGCVICTARRKKCDEVRPVCGPCQRLQFDCRWKDEDQHGPSTKSRSTKSQSLSSRLKIKIEGGGTQDEVPLQVVSRMRRPPTLQPAMVDAVSNGYRAFRDQAQLDFVLQAPRHLNVLVSLTASQDFRDTGVLVTLALQNDWMRDALVAFSAFNAAAATSGERAGQIELQGINAYQSALVQLRRHLDTKSTDVESVKTLTVMTFLGLFESLGTGNAKLACQHFTAALWLSQRLPVPTEAQPVELMLYRIALECWLFNLASLAICHPIPDLVVTSVDWSIFVTAFGRPFTTTRLTLSTSPFIGGSYIMYKLMLNVSWYARQRVGQEERVRQTQRWSAELDRLEEDLRGYFDMLNQDAASLYYYKFLLHVYALRLFLVKIGDHSTSCSSAAVLEVVGMAREVLAQRTTAEFRNPAMAWPLIVFLCASSSRDTPQNMAFFVAAMQDVRDNFDPGHRKRLSAILKVLQSYHGDGDVERSFACGKDCRHSEDTLDLLISEDGVLGR